MQVTTLIEEELEENVTAMTNEELTAALKKSEVDQFLVFRAEQAKRKKEERLTRVGYY